MSEQYRFMRYWLPGSLFMIYLLLLIIPNLSSPGQLELWEILAGTIVASPLIGYLIYAFYNELVYEHACMGEPESESNP